MGEVDFKEYENEIKEKDLKMGSFLDCIGCWKCDK